MQRNEQAGKGDMTISVDRRILKQSLRANKANGFIYLNNPKAGCSTIKASLWASLEPAGPGGNVHAIEDSPFENQLDHPDWVSDAFVFTFVRNPYLRVISSYLNKIAARRDMIWPAFARRHGFDPDMSLEFDSFVECIAADPPSAHDPHWRAQSLNTLAGHVEPNFLGTLEKMDRQLPAVLAYLFPGRKPAIVKKNQHGTSAASSALTYLRDDGTLARLQELYGEDFERFGYARDASDGFASTRKATFQEHAHPSLAHLLATMT